MALRLGMTPYFVALGACLAFAAGCSGSDGNDGKNGANGEPGPAGDPGTPGESATSTPSLSAVSPFTAFLDRTKTVTISGFGTEWSTADAPTVSFGDNVTVDSVTVVSPTALVATISVDPEATLGARDVTVTVGADSLTYEGGFMVESPVALDIRGTAAQGSILFVDATTRDFETLFDTTYTGDGFFSPLVYTNIQVSALDGIEGSIGSVEPFMLSLALFVDVDAAAGEKDIDILSGPDGNQTHFPYPAAFNIEARTPKALAVGTPATGNIAEAYGTELYEFTGSTTSAQYVSIEASGTTADGYPAFMLVPDTGKVADYITWTDLTKVLTDPAGTKYYVIFRDGYGEYGYDFQLDATGVDITLGTDTEPNNAIAQAIDATAMPFAMPGATLSAATDVDWIKYEAVAGDVGKAFHIVTLPGDEYCDTVVAAYGSDGTTLLGEESDDGDYHEDHMSAAIPAAGTYYIRVSYSDAGYDESNYDLIVTLETP